MTPSLSLADLSTSGDLTVFVILICMGFLQLAMLIAFFYFRSEIRGDFREVFSELKANNRSLGNLEGLEKRVTHFEKTVNHRLENLENRVAKTCCDDP